MLDLDSFFLTRQAPCVRNLFMAGRNKTGKTLNPGIGERGRLRRIELEKTKIDIAYALGLTTTRLAEMEKDGVTGLPTIRAWAEALDMDPIELAFGKQEQAPKKKAGKR